MASINREENEWSIVTAFVTVAGKVFRDMIKLLKHVVPRHRIKIVDTLGTFFITLIELVYNIAVFFRTVKEILT